jgi:hypothetical protein
MSRWGATHVLSVERDGKMVAVEVRREGNALFTVLEWAGHEVAAWTLEGGKLCFEGEPWEGAATLLPCPGERLTLDAVLSMVRRRSHGGLVSLDAPDVARIALELGRGEGEVLARIATLRALSLIEVAEESGESVH